MPTVLSMALSPFGIDLNQDKIAEVVMRRTADGTKRTFTFDMCGYVSQFNFSAICYFGMADELSWQILKKAIESKIPVIVTQRFSSKDLVGHARLVTGIQQVGKNNTEIVVYNDPITGRDLTIKKDDFMNLWKPMGSPDIVVKNEMVILWQSKQDIPTDHCISCNGNNTIMSNIDLDKSARGGVFINSNTTIKTKSIMYQCKDCGTSVACFDPIV